MINPKGAPNATETEIAKKLENALIIKGVSMLKLAETAGVNYHSLRRGIRGERAFTVGEFANITRALNIEPTDLLDSAA